jgi:hypothetical protein
MRIFSRVIRHLFAAALLIGGGAAQAQFVIDNINPASITLRIPVRHLRSV